MPSERVRVAITTADEAATVTSMDSLSQLLEALWRYGPEPEGVVVTINPGALAELPPAWTVEEVGQ